MGNNMNRRIKKLETTGSAGIEMLPEHVRHLYHEHFPPEKAQKMLGDMAHAEAVFQKDGKSIFRTLTDPAVEAIIQSILEDVPGE